MRSGLVRGAAVTRALCALTLMAAAGASPWILGDAVAAPAGAITEFSAGLNGGSAPGAIAPGSDGNVWFADEGSTPAIGRITQAGAITEFSTGLSAESRPYGIAAGPDGSLWFTDRGKPSAVGVITQAGAITEFSAGLNTGSRPFDITLGADGNLWFVDRGTTKAIGRVTQAGAITEFSTGLNEGADPHSIAPGADGNLWFTDEGTTNAIGRITPSGAITEFSAGLKSPSVPWGIAAGPDGNMWFTDLVAAVGRITPSGAITEFSAGLGEKSIPVGIATGADGNLWFTVIGSEPAIGQITPAGAITEFKAGLGANAGPVSIAAGADGNMWFGDQGTEKSPAVGQIGTGAAPALLTPPTIAGAGRVGVGQQCAGDTWSTWASVQPSASLFGFDGYRWQLGGAEVAAGPSYTPAASSIGKPLSCTATVTYPLLDVTVSAPSAAVTVAPPMPTIGGVRESSRRWREGRRRARISSASRPRVGTTIAFTASEPVKVVMKFSRLLPGRAQGARCVARTRRNARHHSCEREVPAASLSLAGHGGANKLLFQGRISAKRKLALGRYTLTLTGVNTYGVRSAPVSLSFTIVK